MDEKYMRRAITLAKKGEGLVSPNPLVGCVLVKNDTVIGEGYHRTYGQLHAEREALQNVTEDPKGASAYVTLEPCCHEGKQPPCTDALIAAGIEHVIIGNVDPNPKVRGKGIQQLTCAGIRVTTGFLEKECGEMNEIFLLAMTKERPFIAIKYAMTADGKMAPLKGSSGTISGEKSREYVHMLRNRYDAILIGSTTAMVDNPLLTCRMEGGRNPLRIILDSAIRISPESEIGKSAKDVPTLLVTSSNDRKRIAALERSGVEILILSSDASGIDLDQLMKVLWQRRISSILVEGGATVIGSFLQKGYADLLHLFLAPKFMGEGISPAQKAVLNSRKIHWRHVKPLGEDILLEGEIQDVYRNH